MEYIGMKGEIPSHKMRSLGYITGLTIKYDHRQKHFEVSGTKKNIKTYMPLIEAYIEVFDMEISNQWNTKTKYKESVYSVLFD